jgi:hypothetical protein
MLRAALGFLQLPPRAPELQLLHRWMDSWTGVGLIAVGLHRQGWDLQLTQYGDGKWRATFYVTGAPHSIVGGSAWEPTPWRAVQQACHANEGFPDAVAACGPTQAVKMPSYAGSLPRKRRRPTSAPASARVGRGNQTTSLLGSRVS